MRSRSLGWIASLAAVVLLLPGCDDSDDGAADTTLAATTTTAPPTTTTTAAPTTMPAVQDDTTAVPASIAATWSYQGTVDDWLTEPVMLDGRYYATSKGLDDDTQQEVDGQVEGFIEDGGELWTSLDGVTWIPAEEGERSPPASPGTPTDGPTVVVRRNPIGDQYGMLVAEGLWATSDGTSWREIPLRPSQDNWIPWVATGGLGWVVYSPPGEATVEADGSEAYQGPRPGNLGLWYTPDTEAWFEVTDLGPLADTVGNTVDLDGEVVVAVSDGEAGVFGAAMIVRDTDILVYVNIATASGWVISNPHTEIWRLDLSLGEPVEAFDFSTQSLCEWFSPEEIDTIVARAYEDNDASPIPPPFEEGASSADSRYPDCWWHSGDISTVGLAAIRTGPFYDYDADGPIDERWRPHPALSEGVYVDQEVVVGSHDDYVPGVELRILVEGQEHAMEYWHRVPPGFDGDADAVLAIADEMLRSMGWVPVPGD
jgi:hypothetical protein